MKICSKKNVPVAPIDDRAKANAGISPMRTGFPLYISILREIHAIFAHHPSREGPGPLGGKSSLGYRQ